MHSQSDWRRPLRGVSITEDSAISKTSHRWVVSRSEHGTKLGTFIKDKLGEAFTARGIKRAIESNLCQVNGAMERFASRTLSTGNRVQFQMPEDAPSKTEISVIYQDEDLLVCDKPAGISVENYLKILQKAHPKSQLAHRIDKDTTGLLLFAKTPTALADLERQFKERTVEKTYLAVIDGCPREASGTIENYLGRLHSYEGQAIWGPVPKAKGQLAITSWKLVRRGTTSSVVECCPKTGRTHQIRVHMKGLGHPILGDYQYARHFKSPLRPKRCLLHAWKIAFTHPRSSEQVEFEAPIPEEIINVK